VNLSRFEGKNEVKVKLFGLRKKDLRLSSIKVSKCNIPFNR